jgi:hypothetical protein
MAGTLKIIDFSTNSNPSILLWSDVPTIFPDTIHIHHKTKALPFMRGINYKMDGTPSLLFFIFLVHFCALLIAKKVRAER